MIELSKEKWSMIDSNLWMGGHDYECDDGSVANVVVRDEFDLVLSLYSRYGCGPDEGVERRYARVPDGYLNAAELDTVRQFADLGAEALRAGRRVLVRCQAGYNRSGLLAAFILLRAGEVDASETIQRIRNRRSPRALFNRHFISLIWTEAERLTTEGRS